MGAFDIIIACCLLEEFKKRRSEITGRWKEIRLRQAV